MDENSDGVLVVHADAVFTNVGPEIEKVLVMNDILRPREAVDCAVRGIPLN